MMVFYMILQLHLQAFDIEIVRIIFKSLAIN